MEAGRTPYEGPRGSLDVARVGGVSSPRPPRSAARTPDEGGGEGEHLTEDPQEPAALTRRSPLSTPEGLADDCGTRRELPRDRRARPPRSRGDRLNELCSHVRIRTSDGGTPTPWSPTPSLESGCNARPGGEGAVAPRLEPPRGFWPGGCSSGSRRLREPPDGRRAQLLLGAPPGNGISNRREGQNQ